MNIFKLFTKELTKREKVSAMLKNMAMIADMPKETKKSLNDLDMSVATDEQIDTIHAGLVKLYDQLYKIRKANGDRDLFKLLKEKHN